MNDTAKLKTLIEDIAVNRATIDLLRLEVEKLQSRIAETEEYKEMRKIKDQMARINDEIAAATDEAKARMIAKYELDKEKVFAFGQVKIGVGMEYVPSSAIEWAIEHARGLLILDEKEFEKAAKVMKPPFVTFYDTPKAVLKSDLSAFMPNYATKGSADGGQTEGQ